MRMAYQPYSNWLLAMSQDKGFGRRRSQKTVHRTELGRAIWYGLLLKFAERVIYIGLAISPDPDDSAVS